MEQYIESYNVMTALKRNACAEEKAEQAGSDL
jgi:hypothetical protein